MADAATVLIALKAVNTAADTVVKIKSLFDDSGEVDEKLDEILRQIQNLQSALTEGFAEVLAAVAALQEIIEESIANDAMTAADTVVYSTLARLEKEDYADAIRDALDASYEAARRLWRETRVVFAPSFAYVVNIRLAVIKTFDSHYFCDKRFQDEFQEYIKKLSDWIEELNTQIEKLHTGTIGQMPTTVYRPGGPKPFPHEGNTGTLGGFVGAYIRDGQVVELVYGNSETEVRRAIDRLRKNGIAKDRRDIGVVYLEGVVNAWEDAFTLSLRQALVRDILDRPQMPVDFNRDGMMVDGRTLSPVLDARSTLMEILVSREFRRRIQNAWDGFKERTDERLAKFAHRRLFQRDVTREEVAVLHGVATHYGYDAFVGVLLNSDEYMERYGRGLPGGGDPVTRELRIPHDEAGDHTPKEK